jgi:arsenite methyltransferase
MSNSSTSILENVKNYYGKVLKSSDDLKSQICSNTVYTGDKYVCAAISEVHPAVSAKYYGCGLTIPPGVEGATILDLGSGSGRDCFAVSKLAGPDGRVVGIDMTSEQVNVANNYVQYHMERFAHEQPNVRFIEGFVEDLLGAGLQNDYFDIIISNCVVNLCPNKEAVLSEAFEVLKPGGELYFADMYTDTYQSDLVKKDKILWGEGFAGALHWKQLHQIANQTGFTTPCLVSCSPIEFNKEYFKEKLGEAKYCSATYRLFKPLIALPREIDPSCPSRVASVTYLGQIPHHEESFVFDHMLSLYKGVQTSVPIQKANILQLSRFAKNFKFQFVESSDMDKSWDRFNDLENPFDVLKDKAAVIGQLKPCQKGT